MGLALVFAGGGGKGAYEVGVWRALRESGLEASFSAVIGTSVGALNAALFGQQNLDTAVRIWREISYQKMLAPNAGGQGALVSQSGLRLLLQANLTGSLKKSVYVCCSRIECEKGIWDGEDFLFRDILSRDARSVLFQRKPLFGLEVDEKFFPEFFKLNDFSKERQIEYLLASSALPAVYDAVSIDGKKYRDGGLIKEYNMPYGKAVELGYGRVLAVGLEAGPSGAERVQGSRVYRLNPSQPLGEMLDGTIDFDAGNVGWRMELGYSDFRRHRDEIFSVLKEECGQTAMPGHIRAKLRKMV